MLTFLADLTPAAAVSLGLVPVGLIGFVLAFAPANAAYFDPHRALDRVRPLVWDVSRSQALYPLLREWDNAPHIVRRFLRDAGLTLPALVLLLTTRPKGAMTA